MREKLKQTKIWVRGSMSVLIAVGLFSLVVGLVAADEANTVLDLAVSENVLAPGETFVLTMTLTTPDAEAFGAWQVLLDYDETALERGETWVSEAVVPAGLSATVSEDSKGLYVSDAAFSDNSGSSDPYLLATVEFTATMEGSSGFRVMVDRKTPANDTFYGPAGSGQPRWIPGTINVPQVAIADYEWIGAVDTDWQTMGNWSPNGVPGATDAVGIPGGMVNDPLLSSNSVVGGLYILPGGRVEVPSDYDLTADTVHNYGSLVLWEDVNSGVQTDFHLYDSGSSVSYYGTEITSNGAMNTTSVMINGHQECTNVDEPGNTVNRCFEITPGQQPTYADIRFYYLNTELDNQEPLTTTMQAWHWNTTAMTWTLAGSGSTPGGTTPNFYVDVVQIIDFSPFVLKSGAEEPTAISIQEIQVVSGWNVPGVVLLSMLTLGVFTWRFRKKHYKMRT